MENLKKFQKLKNDIVAKIVFCDKEILAWFLGKIFNTKINELSIKDKNNYQKEVNEQYILNYLKTELEQPTVYNKTKTLDLLIETEDMVIDIEFNSKFGKEERIRNTAYINGIYCSYTKKSNVYKNQKDIIQLNLCFDLNKFDCDEYCIEGLTYHKMLVNNLKIYVYNLAYYKSLLYNDNIELINKYKHLIMFDCDLEELKKLSKGDYIMEKICKKVEELNDENGIFRYISPEEDYQMMLNTKYLIGKEEGYDMGKEEGYDMGIEQGYDIGKEEGITETYNKMALALLSQNIPINVIATTTGLDYSAIESLKQGELLKN